MTANDFRKLALSHPETEERQHMDHPDFRVAGKIFATLGYPDKTRGMVKLTPEDLRRIDAAYPAGSASGQRYHEAMMVAINR